MLQDQRRPACGVRGARPRLAGSRRRLRLPHHVGRSRRYPCRDGRDLLHPPVGDPAFGWEADHLEPGVSIRHPADGDEHALHYLACMGNEAVVTSGACVGARGTVTGEHAHILVDFPPDEIELLAVGDEILIHSIGTGLKLLDHPDVITHKLSPRLVEMLDLRATADGKLEAGVVAEIPSHLMGSGAELSARLRRPGLHDRGSRADRRARARPAPAGRHRGRARRGPRLGPRLHPGAVTIGLIIHGDSAWTGHGPGVLDLLSSRSGAIVPRLVADQNIALGLGLRTREELAVHQPGAHVSSYATRI